MYLFLSIELRIRSWKPRHTALEQILFIILYNFFPDQHVAKLYTSSNSTANLFYKTIQYST